MKLLLAFTTSLFITVLVCRIILWKEGVEVMTTYVLYLRDAFGAEAENELQFMFKSLKEVYIFISLIDKTAAESYVYELRRED